MKFLTAGAAIVSACVLSACGMLGGQEGPPPDSPAARAPAALPPPTQPAPVASAPAAPPVPEDLPAVPASQVRCIPPYVLQTTEKDGVTDARCVAPSEVSGLPKN